jgi:hypothetical protein
MEAGRWSDAAGVYQTLLGLIRRESRNNHFNEIGCLYALAKCNVRLGHWREAGDLAQEGLSLLASPDVARRKARDLDGLKRILSDVRRQVEH